MVVVKRERGSSELVREHTTKENEARSEALSVSWTSVAHVRKRRAKSKSSSSKVRYCCCSCCSFEVRGVGVVQRGLRGRKSMEGGVLG